MIYALPGMGADNRMYPGPWRSLPGATFLDWPGYKGEDSIQAIAWRVAIVPGRDNRLRLIGAKVGLLDQLQPAGQAPMITATVGGRNVQRDSSSRGR